MTKLLISVLVLISPVAAASDVENHAFLYGCLTGSYLAVGQEPEGGGAYRGRVVFEAQGDHLAVTREVGGEGIAGVGKIEHALGADEADVLRVRFMRGGRDFEITYLWRSDLDNYPRLSGYVYERGKKTEMPGLEALFIDHTAR